MVERLKDAGSSLRTRNCHQTSLRIVHSNRLDTGWELIFQKIAQIHTQWAFNSSQFFQSNPWTIALQQPYWGACTSRAQSLREAIYSRIVDEKKRGERNTNLFNRRHCNSTLIGLLPWTPPATPYLNLLLPLTTLRTVSQTKTRWRWLSCWKRNWPVNWVPYPATL